MSRALVLFDRDGTLIEERHFLRDPAGVSLIPRAARALALLRQEGVLIGLCTNQSGVARGIMTGEDVEAVNRRLVELLATEGARLDALRWCGAHEESADPLKRADLHRRKPEPGMAREIIAELHAVGLPVFAVGDKLADVEFGRRAGGEGLLVLTGYGAKELASHPAANAPPIVASDAYDAAAIILNRLVLRDAPEDRTLARKLKSPGELGREVDRLKAAGRVTVLANGCFDLLHGGHVSFLEDARAKGDCLVLAVNSNASISRLKGRGRPILDEAPRLQMLAALRCVDYLTVFHTDSADETLEEIRPDCHAKGTDYRDDNVPELATSRRLGIRTVIAGAPKENSTRDIIEVVLERAKAGLL